MLKKLLVPTLVLTMAGFVGVGCHDSSGNGTSTGTGGTGGSDAAVSDAETTDGDAAATEDGDAASSETGDASVTETGDAATGETGDAAATETGDAALAEVGLDGAATDVEVDALASDLLGN